jgi:hypothetical protein
MSYFDPPDKTQSVSARLAKTLHPALPPLPGQMKARPIDERGFPVPWFVQWFHADGSKAKLDYGVLPGDYPDFRVIDSRKMKRAVEEQLCWVCGGPLGKFLAFTIGPMCAVNRTSGEPPAHRACAEFSARACPFLTKPKVERRENDLPMPEEIRVHPGMLTRNPGVAMVWITTYYRLHQDPNGVLFRIGPPVEVLYFCEGRPATRAEVMHSIDTGMPMLREVAEKQGAEALTALNAMYEEAILLVPAR